ncbi:hydrophobin [Trichoderma virens Gv29-8]|uniref:Class I hydrophobin Hfb3 n=1 Tax=Hypocrea virens (strain Gv29-8 / FGSC 10586) TaxID=413071 RepID=HFB3_HYPVG|nr:hydrophobin [Trichoderma virens Gv29-8]EHK25912.1 hydrophobin [Trichoderma virens Gv29-8]
MYTSIIFYALIALNGVMASPAQGPEVEPRAIEPRIPSLGDIPFPKFPARNPNSNKMGGGNNNNCPSSSGTSTQSNACSSGSPYCCSSDGNGGHVCSNTTACDTTIICCNNNNGFQICIGELDFNAPITINIYE